MKIAFFSGDITRTGGTERVCLQIANELAQLKQYQVHIVSLWENCDDTAFSISPRIQRKKLFNASFSLTKKYPFLCLKLRHFLKSNKIDILIDVDVILSLVSIPAALFLKTKVIAWEHFHYHETLGCKTRAWGRNLAKRYADAIIVLSKADEKNYKKAHAKCPIYHIYNPVYPLDKPVDYNPKSQIILSVGRLNYQKGFDFIPRIAKPIFEKHPDWQWIILGEGEDRPLIESEIKKYELEKQIILVGRQNVAEFYTKASIYVMTSRFEGFGLVLIEALSYHLPCISFTCPHGPDEIIIDSENGYLIPVGNFDLMSSKILDLIYSEGKRVSFSQKTNLSCEKFKLEGIISEWQEVLGHL